MCMCLCVYVCACACVGVYCVCVCVYMCACSCVHTCVHTHIEGKTGGWGLVWRLVQQFRVSGTGVAAASVGRTSPVLP